MTDLRRDRRSILCAGACGRTASSTSEKTSKICAALKKAILYTSPNLPHAYSDVPWNMSVQC